MTDRPADALFFEAAHRNRVPIAEALALELPDHGLVVEIGAGGGQHAAWFSGCFPHLHCCLLYTSPSPRDQRGSRMPSSA